MIKERPAGGWKHQLDSYSVLVVYFKDGNVTTRYSLDWQHRYSSRYDIELGLTRLNKLLSEYGDNVKNAMISLNDSSIPKNRTLLQCYGEGGIKIPCPQKDHQI